VCSLDALQLDKATADAHEMKAGYDKFAADAAEFKAGFDKALLDNSEQKAQARAQQGSPWPGVASPRTRFGRLGHNNQQQRTRVRKAGWCASRSLQRIRTPEPDTALPVPASQLDKATADAAELKAGFDKATYDAVEMKAGFDKATADAAEFKAGFDKAVYDNAEQQAQARSLSLPCPPFCRFAGSSCLLASSSPAAGPCPSGAASSSVMAVFGAPRPLADATPCPRSCPLCLPAPSAEQGHRRRGRV
jgi:hypothetical protein